MCTAAATCPVHTGKARGLRPSSGESQTVPLKLARPAAGLSEGKEALPVQSALTRLGRALQQADAASQAPASAEQTANALSVRLAGRSLPKQPVKPALYSSFTCTGERSYKFLQHFVRDLHSMRTLDTSICAASAPP